MNDLRIRAYVSALAAGLIALLIAATVMDASWDRPLVWAIFALLFIATESAVLLFHHQVGKVGLSATEGVYLPMLVALSFSQVVWAVAIAALVVNLRELHRGGMKSIFNVANFGCAAAAGAATFHLVVDDPARFTPRTALAAVAGVVIFNILTHVFVAGAIALSGGGRFLRLFAEIAVAASLNLAINIAFGLLLAAAFVAETWTLALFPLPIAAFFFSYRALLREISEQERVEHLHAATRALATSASLEDAVRDFLTATRDVVSAREARVVLSFGGERLWASVDVEGRVSALASLEGGSLTRLIDSVDSPDPRVVTEGTPASAALRDLGASSAVIAPLVDDGEVAGWLLALDRIGAGDYSQRDATMLQALGHELVLTLDSYRLFAEVSEERERFMRIFNASKEGIALLDDKGCVQAWNPALENITGYREAEVRGRLWSDAVVVRDPSHLHITGLDLVELSPGQELEVVTKEGPSRWAAVASTAITAGGERAWVVLVRDVTAEHLAEEAKSDFLSTVSHELRTPLTTIKGSMQILARGYEKTSPGMFDQMVSVLRRGTERLERLVLNLLFVSQIEANGTIRVVPEDLDLKRVVEDAADRLLADYPDLDLELEGVPQVMVAADRERIGQVVEHLLENAEKFGDGKPIRVTLHSRGRDAVLGVHDQGPGIPTVDQERIFERFVRLGHVLTRETQGPGVGLFIVKHAIEAMGGRVWVESKPGEGASFYMTIPLAQMAPVASPA